MLEEMQCENRNKAKESTIRGNKNTKEMTQETERISTVF